MILSTKERKTHPKHLAVDKDHFYLLKTKQSINYSIKEHRLANINMAKTVTVFIIINVFKYSKEKIFLGRNYMSNICKR